MGIRVGSIVVNCADLDAMSSFWSEALDLTPGPIVEDDRFQDPACRVMELVVMDELQHIHSSSTHLSDVQFQWLQGV